MTLLLALIVVCAVIRPAFVIYTQHMNPDFAEQPFATLLEIGVVAPCVIVPGAMLILIVGETWKAIGKVVLMLLPVGWLLPLFVVPMSLGCSDVGGLSEPCGVSVVSTAREIVALAIAACVSALAVFLHRRGGTTAS
jgi:hypothetical protein